MRNSLRVEGSKMVLLAFALLLAMAISFIQGTSASVEAAPPVVLHDESVNGDLGGVGATTYLGSFGPGSYTIRGSASLGDRDFFGFDVQTGLILGPFVLDSLSPDSPSVINFNLDLTTCCSLTPGGRILDAGRVGTDLMNGNTGPQGPYEGSLFNFRLPAMNVAYQLTFTISPPTLRVGPTQSYATIQSAINDAIDGALILVEDGVYNENLIVNKEVTIEAVNSGGVTVNGGGGSLVVDFERNGTLKGLHITNGGQGIHTRGNGDILMRAERVVFSDLTRAVLVDQSGGRAGRAEIVNSTVYNTVNAFEINDGNTIDVINTIVANTSGTVYTNANGNRITPNHNLVFNSGSLTSGSVDVDPARIVANPLFVDAANDDYRLQYGSPALDSGLDALGEPFVGSAPDRGAFEGPVDVTPPTVTATVTGSIGNNDWYVSDVSVSWLVSDNETAVTTTGCSSTDTTTDTAGTTLTCTATSEGGTTSESVSFKRDATAPTINGSASPGANTNGWNNTDVTVSYVVGDNLSGVDAGASDAGDDILSSEGAGQSASGSVTDNAGNTASVTVGGINIDKTSPTISGSASPGPNGNGWNNTDVTVSYTVDDALSGVDTGASDDGDDVLSSEGAGQSASGSVTDLAGNSAAVTVSGINIDKTAPTISGSASPGANANGWNNTDVDVTFDCDDGLSGVASCLGDTTLASEGAGQSVGGSVTDLAGNTASDTVSGINIDKTAPTISGNASPAANANGWNNTDVTVSYTVDDALSGVDAGASDAGDDVLSSEGAGQSDSGSVTDLAGNTASDTVSGINIDKTAPVVTSSRSVAPNANGWNNTSVTVSYSASDGLSGIDAGASDLGDDTLSSEGAGQSTTGTAVDLAGNSASATESPINIDLTDPVVTVEDQSGRDDSEAGAVVDYTGVSGSDALSGVDGFVCAPPSGSTFPVGITAVNCTATDLAGNTSSDGFNVVVVDDCDCTEGKGFWKNEFKKAAQGKTKGRNFDDSTLDSYLDIVDYSSEIFDSMTIASANDIFNSKKSKGGDRDGSRNGSKSKDADNSRSKTNRKKKGGDDSDSNSGSNSGKANKLEKKLQDATSQLLAAWLNYAKGAVDLDEQIEIESGGDDDSGSKSNTRKRKRSKAAVTQSFSEIVAEVESILANPDATKGDLERAKDLAESVNVHDKDNPDCDTTSGSGSDIGSGSGSKSKSKDDSGSKSKSKKNGKRGRR